MARSGRPVGLVDATYLIVAWVFLGCILVQAFLVGLDVFADGNSAIHRDFAYLYGWLAPALVLLASAAGLPVRTRALTLVLLVLFAIQTVLPSQRDAIPLLAALHTPNALAIFGVSVVLARRASREVRWQAVRWPVPLRRRA